MPKLPKGWKITSDNKEVVSYAQKDYIIYIWKHKTPKPYFSVEPFRKLTNYKRRLFSKKFSNITDAKKFARNLMRQKEIRGYYSK